jgi:hypothetical protein
MAWRKVHLDGEVWEWQTGKNVTHYVIIRSPTGVATRVSSSRLGAVEAPTNEYDDDGMPIMAYAVKPGLVKAYIESHKASLLVKRPRKTGGRK